MNIFYQCYHVAVDATLILDLGSCDCTIYMPNSNWGGKINFHRANDEFARFPFVKLISYEEFLNLEKLSILIPCAQLLDDLLLLKNIRNNPQDNIILLSALSNSVDSYPKHLTDYVISHDIYYHRITDAKYKMLYFSPPEMLINEPKDIEKCFNEKQIKLYINNFTKEGFEPEYQDAKKFRELWIKETNKMVPFYGWDNEQGTLNRKDVQLNMLDSMFTLVFKRRETWGQMVNESMMLGTPCIFLKKYMYSTLKYYEVTEDNSIICESVEEIIERLKNMTLEEYETLVIETQKTALMFADPISRRFQLNWLLNKLS